MVYINNLIVKNPVVSVCIPTYNQEGYIIDTLDSVISQRVNVPFEIIIADDCSSDNTKEVCLGYQKRFPEKIKFISNEKNLGVVKNLFNVLFASSNGRYIAICAGDDIWIDEYKLQKQLKVLEGNGEISIVHTGYNKVNELGLVINSISNWKSPLLNIYGKQAISHIVFEDFSSFPLASSVMFRASAINRSRNNYENLVFDEDAPGEAMILFSLAALDGKFAFIPDIMVNYRYREESLSHYKDIGDELIFNFKFRIIQKTKVVKTFINDIRIIKKVNRSLLSLFFRAINNKHEKTFMVLYNNYARENPNNIPRVVKFCIPVFSLNSTTKKLFVIIYSQLIKIKLSLIKMKNKQNT